MVAVAQARPEVYLPAEAPARAVVASYFERASASVRKFGRAVCCYQMRGVQTVEHRAVAVVYLRFFLFVVPLEKLTFFADFKRQHIFKLVFENFCKLLVLAEDVGSLDAVFKQLADYAHRHCRRLRNGAVAAV